MTFYASYYDIAEEEHGKFHTKSASFTEVLSYIVVVLLVYYSAYA